MSDFDAPVRLADFTVVTVVTSPPWYENCYLVRHDKSGDILLIDPGSDADKIADAVAEVGGTPKAILLTHGHPDHLGAAHAIEEKFAVPCLAHRDEQPLISRVADWSTALMQTRLEGPKDCRYFDADPPVSAGGAAVKAIHCPGHTPGGVCYAFPGFAFTGDTLFNHGIGRTDLPGGDGRKLAQSISSLLQQLPDETLLFSGHGPHWNAGEARQWWSFMF